MKTPACQYTSLPVFARRTLVLLLLCVALGATAWASPDPRELLNAGRADAAIRVLTPLATGSNADAYNLLGRAYYAVEDWDNAVSNCERAAKLEPGNAIYQLWLGRSYGEKAESTKNLLLAYQLARKTVAAFAQAHQLDPRNTAIARDLAEYYTTAPAIVGGSISKAQALADELSAEHPADAAWIRGRAAAAAGHQDEAEQRFQEAIRLDHNSARTILDLAAYLKGRKDWERFQQMVERAMQSPQIKPTDRYDAAEMLFKTNRDLEGAVRLLRAYIESEHTDEGNPVFRAHYLLGQTLQKLGDTGQAATEFRAALGLASSYRPAIEALRRMGQPLEAKQ